MLPPRAGDFQIRSVEQAGIAASVYVLNSHVQVVLGTKEITCRLSIGGDVKRGLQ